VGSDSPPTGWGVVRGYGPMLSLPHIWTPRKTLWLPGMSLNPLGRFGVGTDCCEEIAPCLTCTGSAPNTLLASIRLLSDGTCGDCESLNGDYVLTYDQDTDALCHWFYEFPTPICNWYGIVFGFSAGDFTYQAYLAFYPVTGIGTETPAFYNGDISSDCASWDALNLPRVTPASTECTYSSATCTITAL
jgi:hypothetical protein